ncbi:hypothetical protein CH278_00240 [Rhodococcus sp. 05-2254-5]|uniref:hypothetical protein n=1 Tax=Nocardiaceae TaxID=85025 RepID=UPI00055D3E31|nr:MULTISPECIES: hypothetical protein [Rhodococcus]OZE39703.1 hypothetical protein CH278_00240 [Rhodococcus sp. 05-2254-5]OZE60838.1 hypothetical protein CH269_04190 [Rhodococcus sp. 05-2254-1]OZE97750.1 hypothetical protein CH302_13070 [Rhodococcus sp. 15-2388-1-1a]
MTAVADMWISDHTAAAQHAREASDKLAAADETEHAAFWRYVEAHAHFTGGTPKDFAAARNALEDATHDGPRTAWFQRLRRTISDLDGFTNPADDTDQLFLAWDEWRREAGTRLAKEISAGRALLAGMTRLSEIPQPRSPKFPTRERSSL